MPESMSMPAQSPSPSDPEFVLPCGHTVRQSALTGCTPDECRPQDEKISRDYFAVNRKK